VFRSLGWRILFLFLAGVLSAPVYLLGAQESVIELSTQARIAISVIATVAGAFVGAWAVLTSRSGSVDSVLVSLRHNRTGAWILRILGMVAMSGLTVAVLAWMWVLVLIRNLPGEQVAIAGQVVHRIRTGTENLFCHDVVDVLFEQNSQERICIERGLGGRATPAALHDLARGDHVTVVLRKTALGTTATIVHKRN